MVLSKDPGAPMCVRLAGVTYPSSGYSISRARADIYVIEYVTDGVGYVEIGDEMHKVGAGTVYLLYEGDKHSYHADRENPFRKIFMNINGELCATILRAHGLYGKHFFKNAEEIKPVFDKIEELVCEGEPDPTVQSVLQGLFLEAVSRLSRMVASSKHSDEAIALKEYIDSRLSDIVTAKELSKVIFRSADYCLKLFKREFGITPYAYQLDKKIRVAKDLLKNTSMSIGEIAESVGYGDLHYFSNLFYSKCGMRPIEYRKGYSTDKTGSGRGPDG